MLLKSSDIHFGSLAFFTLFVFWPLLQYTTDILRWPLSHIALSANLIATLILLPQAKRLVFTSFFCRDHRNILAGALLFWLVAVAVVQYSTLNQVLGPMTLKTVGIDFGLPILYFFLGFSMREFSVGRKYFYFIVALCLIYAILSFYAWEKYFNPQNILRARLAACGILISYQSLGDALAVLGIGLFVNRHPLKGIGFAAILLVMYLISSWGAFVSFTCCVALYALLNSRRKSYLLLLVVVTTIIFWDKASVIILNIWETSVASRAAILHYRLEHMPNLLLGTYHIEIFEGRTGYYIHNGLSFIEQYGIIYFISYIYLFINLLVSTGRRIKIDNLCAYAFYCLIYSLVIFIFIRDCFSPIPWLSIGFALLTVQNANDHNDQSRLRRPYNT